MEAQTGKHKKGFILETYTLKNTKPSRPGKSVSQVSIGVIYQKRKCLTSLFMSSKTQLSLQGNITTEKDSKGNSTQGFRLCVQRFLGVSWEC